MANSKMPSYQQYATQVPLDQVAEQSDFKKLAIFSSQIKKVAGTVAATGSAQTDAATLPANAVVYVTDADATKGVILPRGEAGLQIYVHNVANAVLKVYPHVGGDINDGTTDAALSQAAKKPVMYTSIDATTWSALISG